MLISLFHLTSPVRIFLHNGQKQKHRETDGGETNYITGQFLRWAVEATAVAFPTNRMEVLSQTFIL